MKNQLFIIPEGKTNYQIVNEQGEKTTISLEKWVADILQQVFDNVHAKIQAAYNRLLESNPGLTRRQRGDRIRSMAETSANLHQELKKNFWDGMTDSCSIFFNRIKFITVRLVLVVRKTYTADMQLRRTQAISIFV